MTNAQKDEVVRILRRIAEWTPDLQKRVEKEKTGVLMWRGCVAEAKEALQLLGEDL